jgi:hypothetical protein
MTTILLARLTPSDDFARNFAAQLALLQGPRPVRPPVIAFDMPRSTMADTRVTRNLLLQYHLPAVIVVQRNAVLEGPCTTEPNRKLRCLIDGVCDGQELSDRQNVNSGPTFGQKYLCRHARREVDIAVKTNVHAPHYRFFNLQGPRTSVRRFEQGKLKVAP